MADYLEAYQARFDLPVRGGVRVRTVSRDGEQYVVTCTDGSSYTCDNVVVATGTFGRTPNVPAFAGELDPAIRQLHSSDYKRPSQLKPGGVLVVGASHSGGDIAFEAGAAGHPVVLSGPIHGEIPFRPGKPAAKVVTPILFFLAKHVLTMRTPLGRKMRAGDPRARRPADPGEEGGPRPGRRRDGRGPHGRRAGRPAGAGRRPRPRRDERRVVHRLQAGLLLDRPADHRRRRLADGAARRRGRGARALLRRPGLPVRVLLDAGRRRRPGRRVRREAARLRGRPRLLGPEPAPRSDALPRCRCRLRRSPHGAAELSWAEVSHRRLVAAGPDHADGRRRAGRRSRGHVRHPRPGAVRRRAVDRAPARRRHAVRRPAPRSGTSAAW